MGNSQGGESGEKPVAVSASAAVYDGSGFQAHVQALAKADEEVLAACELAAGNLANKQAAIAQHLQAAAKAGHETAPELLEAIKRNPQTTAQILTAFKAVMETLKPASAMDMIQNAALASRDDKQTFAAMLYRRAAVMGQEGSFQAMSTYGNRLEAGAGVRANPKAALLWLRHGAESGDFDCMVQYAISLMKSKSTQKEALHWYKKAADGGYAGAQVNLGMCYEKGTGVKKDLKQALFWYEKAAAQNNPTGLQNAANCHNHGWGTKKDLAAGAAWLRRGAEAGVAIAQARLANCYEEGEGVEKSWEQAVYWYRKAAEQGEVVSQFNLGNCYMQGWGVEVDKDEAALWYGRAALQGLQQAAVAIARHGLEVPDEDTLLGRTPEQAYALHLAAAQAGDPDEMVQVAECLMGGRGVERNVPEAISWLKKSAEGGNGHALKGLGQMYIGSIPGLPEAEISGAKALECFAKAEARGVDCTNALADLFMKGKAGVPRDGEKAVAILRAALARSHVIPEYKKAADFKAMITGDHEAGSKEASDAAAKAGKRDKFNMSAFDVCIAHFNLGELLEFGFGCKQNLQAAKAQYSAAADRFPMAKARLTEIELKEAAGGQGPAFFEGGVSKFRSVTRVKADGSSESVIQGPGPQDWPEVVECYRENAESEEEAKFFLASLYERGALGVEKDVAKAKELYTAAAAKGVWWAEQALARMERNGVDYEGWARDGAEKFEVRQGGGGGGILVERNDDECAINYEVALDFLVQACVGIFVNVKRLQLTGKAELKPGNNAYINLGKYLMAMYFNKCWLSLLKNDDEFVTQTFARMGHRSPACVFNVLLSVCTAVMPADDPFPNTNSIDTYREQLRMLFRQLIALGLPAICRPHACSGMTLQQERQQWVAQGCPDVELVSIREGGASG